MNDIKIGQLYQHTPTGIVRRVVYVDKNYVALKGVIMIIHVLVI